ncbi:MAG: cytochrome C oxidase subunit IV family protein [Chloroflexi bacterium]|nr:cytochrome C oxidase subunit IV family protein [Chloroflexota bacterium]
MRSHNSQPGVMTVLGGLMVLTAVEFALSQIGAGLLLLLVIAFFKFLLIVVFFMHMPRLWTPAADEKGEATHP